MFSYFLPQSDMQAFDQIDTMEGAGIGAPALQKAPTAVDADMAKFMQELEAALQQSMG